jgi:hypothetical protein
MPKRTCALRPIAFLENESLSVEDGGDPIDGEGYNWTLTPHRRRCQDALDSHRELSMRGLARPAPRRGMRYERVV